MTHRPYVAALGIGKWGGRRQPGYLARGQRGGARRCAKSARLARRNAYDTFPKTMLQKRIAAIDGFTFMRIKTTFHKLEFSECLAAASAPLLARRAEQRTRGVSSCSSDPSAEEITQWPR